MAGLKLASRPAPRAGGPSKGFTLLELIVVITIMGVLVSIALPNYRNSILQAKEAVLRANLYRLRDLIDQYQSDKGTYPETLETLVTSGYLRAIPPDPMTSDPWIEIPPETDSESTEMLSGVFDVKSASSQIGMNGVAYSEW